MLQDCVLHVVLCLIGATEFFDTVRADEVDAWLSAGMPSVETPLTGLFRNMLSDEQQEWLHKVLLQSFMSTQNYVYRLQYLSR